MTGRLFTILVVLVLNFVGTVFLESRLEKYAGLEVAIIVIGVLLSVIALAGIAGGAGWAWPFATILFSLSLANVLFLHVNVGAFITFMLLAFVNIVGLLASIFSVEDAISSAAAEAIAEPAAPLETYAMAAEPKVTYKTEAKARGRKKR
jgi:hypothetical protein